MISFTLTERQSDSQICLYYRVAGIDVLANTEIANLRCLFLERREGPYAFPNYDTELEKFSLIYDAPGQFSSGERQVRCLINGGTTILQVEGLEEFTIVGDGSIRYSVTPDTSVKLLQEVLVGPPLILQMVRMNVYCLHASAVRIGGGVCLFAGESGRGKSTLANYSNTNWTRLCDDITPISGFDLTVRPHFPQLKLAAREQYPISAVETEPLCKIFVLNTGSNATVNEIILQRLQGPQAMLAILRHTVSSKLFSANLHKTHMLFAERLSKNIEIYQLSYPMVMDKLNEVRDIIINSCNE